MDQMLELLESLDDGDGLVIWMYRGVFCISFTGLDPGQECRAFGGTLNMAVARLKDADPRT